MTEFNYKEYSLSNLRNWISDAMSSGDASAKEIYDTIVSEVDDYSTYLKKQYENVSELQNLLRGHRSPVVFNDSWTSVVEEDSITGEQWITLPQELIEKLDWKEGDTLSWENNYDGTFTLRKV